MRTVRTGSMVTICALTLIASSPSSASDGMATPQSTPQTRILLSFKLDSRVLGPTYGGERWVSPPKYTGAQAQHAVDTMARAVDARGAPVNTDAEWAVSDPELLTVSPPRGKRVTITAKRPGVSTVTVKAGGTSRTVRVEAEKRGGTWQVSVSQ